jgi:hypothetical protein
MTELEELKVEELLKFIEEMNYGEVVFTIHDSQIVQTFTIDNVTNFE